VVRTGLDVLISQDLTPLRGRNVGLVTHPAAVDGRLRHVDDHLAATKLLRLVALFGPEHGLLGQAQDLIGVPDGLPLAEMRIVSLYGDSVKCLKPTREQLQGIDLLVIDMQDIGARYYTFQATMLYCLEAAARDGIAVMVLDRPNPLGGIEIEGPTVQPGFESFVGAHPIPIRHGLTIGELALLYRSERRLNVDLTVISCEGLRREMLFPETGLPWVMPSPNMPTFDTALVYPGQCLIEGTNLSEGRGTTRPFEIVGAPGIDSRLGADRLNAAGLAGVTFRPTWFQPTFQKFAGQLCGGVQLHVTDARAFRPVRVGLMVLATLRELAGPAFDWRRTVYEFVSDRSAIDLLFGSPRERLALEDGAKVADIAQVWNLEEAEFRERRQGVLLYS